MSAAPLTKLSVEDYLALDRGAEVNSEYHDGEIFRIEDASWNHGVIGTNIAHQLKARLTGTSCRAANPVRVQITATQFVYPDLVVVCGKPMMTDNRADTITNPRVVIEILSPSTEGYNYGRKLSLYSMLSSFEEYVLVAQDEPRVDVLRKAPDGTWILGRYTDRDRVAKLQSLGIELPLNEIYDGIEWTSSPST